MRALSSSSSSETLSVLVLFRLAEPSAERLTDARVGRVIPVGLLVEGVLPLPFVLMVLETDAPRGMGEEDRFGFIGGRRLEEFDEIVLVDNGFFGAEAILERSYRYEQ